MLSELTASTRRVALVGLAKNTGKTEALAALLRELEARGRPVGVTSVGRDGEEHDVIDARIQKPRVRLAAGSLVASTDGLLRASALAHDLLEDTGVRTPLGRVLVARLKQAGAIEVAGPSAAADVRAAADAMLTHGAEQVLIDGAIDRRAASSPEVADGLILCTGAVLDRDLETVVAQTREAVALVRLPAAQEKMAEAARRALAGGDGALLDEGLEAHPLPARFFLAERAVVEGILKEGVPPRSLVVPGALPEAFLEAVLPLVRRSRRALTIVVADPTKVFLWKRGPEWFERQGVALRVLERIALRAITVNPFAPQSHSFDSLELRALIQEAIPDVPVFDVLHADYAGPGPLERPAALGAS